VLKKMQIKNIDFLLTFKCTAKCRHCSYKAGPHRKGYIKAADAEKYILELSLIQPLESITVHGGEPFLYFNDLKRILIRAKELGIRDRGLITNAFWGETRSNLYGKFTEIVEAGLTRITFSADGFHQEFVPIQYVKNAILSAIKCDLENIWVDSYFLDDFNTDNSENIATKKAIEFLKDLENVEFNKYLVSYEGRAAELVRNMTAQETIPSGKCPLPFWIGGDLKNPTTIEIDSMGNVTLCPGICIGNTNQQLLTSIVQNYDAQTHPILSILMNEGHKGLLKLAVDHGFKRSQDFINECHFCYEIRKFLHKSYPLYLAPASCYLPDKNKILH